MVIYCKFCGGASTDASAEVCRRCGRYYDGRKVVEYSSEKSIIESTLKPKEFSKRTDYHLMTETILKDIYRIVNVIGEGGFGITYKAEDIRTKKYVAIKELYCKELVYRGEEPSNDVMLIYEMNSDMVEKTKKRFLGEAKTLMKFSGLTGIVQIINYFEENKTAYLVMEYLDGMTLRDYINETGRLQWRQVIEMVKPMMESLAKIHEEGLIHRDISGSNIIVRPDGSLVLLDFGAAKMLLQKESYTNTSVFAKKGYTPIEQYSEDGNIGPWTDVYAMTAVIYECIVGELPPDSLQRAIYDEYKTMKEKGLKVPNQLELICSKGLSVKYGERFQSMSDLKEALEVGLEVHGTSKKSIFIIIMSMIGIALLVFIFLNS